MSKCTKKEHLGYPIDDSNTSFKYSDMENPSFEDLKQKLKLDSNIENKLNRLLERRSAR